MAQEVRSVAELVTTQVTRGILKIIWFKIISHLSRVTMTSDEHILSPGVKRVVL